LNYQKLCYPLPTVHNREIQLTVRVWTNTYMIYWGMLTDKLLLVPFGTSKCSTPAFFQNFLAAAGEDETSLRCFFKASLNAS